MLRHCFLNKRASTELKASFLHLVISPVGSALKVMMKAYITDQLVSRCVGSVMEMRHSWYCRAKCCASGVWGWIYVTHTYTDMTWSGLC